jgi:formate hydrogenlyase subunit 6/NADH:ubiquinone oxidoreductase subunit I
MEKNQPNVVNPNNCVILCKGCQDICPSGAIDHPSRKETINLIRKFRRIQEIKKNKVIFL